MPTLTRWFIRTSFIYFLLALLTGVILGLAATGIIHLTANLSPAYIHLLVEGWITMLIIGVATWMFPKLTLEKPRGSEILGWSSYILLNTGLLLRIISEPSISLDGQSTSVWAILLTIAAAMQWGGGIAFVLNAWGRVKVK